MTEWQDLGQVRPSNQEIINMIYPVGAIYISVNSANPTTLFGGTWQQLTDTFLYASTTADNDVTTAPSGQGEATHTLTTNEMPSHTHTAGKYDGYMIENQAAASGSAVNAIKINTNSTTSSTRILTNSAGSSQAHNNMPPYMKVYMWKRTG